MDPARNHKVKWTRIAALALAIPGCYLAYLLGTALGPVQSKSNQPEAESTTVRLPNGLEIEAAELDIGEAWGHPEFIRPVTITNRGKAEAVVTDLSGGCECTSIEPHAFVLPPGRSKQVNIKIDLTHRFPHHFGLDRRELAVTVTPTLAQRGLSAEAWKVTGVIKSRVSLESRGLEFADLCSSGGPPVTRKMRATAHVPLKALVATVPPGMGRTEVRNVPGDPDRWDVLVTPEPNRPQGPFKFDVALTAIGEDGVKSPCASFHVHGEMVSPVRIIPNPVLLGEHPVGTKAEAIISIRLPSTAWKVERIESESSDTDLAIQMENPPGFRISQAVKSGDRSSQVRVLCRRPDGRLETIIVPVFSHGEMLQAGASR